MLILFELKHVRYEKNNFKFIDTCVADNLLRR